MKKQKVFCISLQRTGTTSVGKFLQDFNFSCVGWSADQKNNWSDDWYKGDYEKIFASLDFKSSNAFEDSPWFFPDFYKILFNRFPSSKFILFVREPESWFQSMVRHSKGNILGKSAIHCKIYRREKEYFDLLSSGNFDEEMENQLFSEKTMKIIGYAEHYKNIYRLHHVEVQDFFRKYAPESIYLGRLEDDDKWQKLGAFLGVEVPDGYRCHENSSQIIINK